MNLQQDIPTLPPSWARRDLDPFPTYVGVALAPAPPPRAPLEGEPLEVAEALRILDRLIHHRRRREAVEPPTVVVTPAKTPSWAGPIEGDDDEEAVDLDLFCASFEATERGSGRALATA